ncbi:hypothetical protein Tco_1227116 [Tanacetum coccineum]
MDETHASRYETHASSYHSSIWCAPFEALYGRKCRSPVLWAEIGESSLIGPELVQEMTDKVVLIKASRDRQKRLCLNNRDRKLRVLGRRRFIGIKADPEFTWERKDHMKSKYPQLFVDRAVESASSLEVIPSSKGIKFKCLHSLESKIEKKERTKAEKDPTFLKHITSKKLKEDYDTSGDAGASTAGKSLAMLQDLLDRSTLAVEISVTAAATMPFVTSSVTLTPERKGGGHTDSVFGPNLCTHHPAERFVISSDSSHHSSTNAADVEVTSIVRSPIPPPLVMTAPVATTAVASTSYVPEAGIGPTIQSLFADSASPSATGPNTTGPSDPHGTEISADTFYISKEMDFETLQQIYIPKWNMINDSSYDDPDFNVGAARQTCLSTEVRLRFEHNLRERKKFERKCARQTDLLKDKDTEIASLKAQLSLKEVEAAVAIHLRSQVSAVEAAKAARVSKLNSLKERNTALEGEKSTLEGQVATLESAAASKDTELASVNTQVAKLNHDLSSLQLSCDELSIKAASLESQKDSLTDQVSVLETTCSGLHDQVSGYEPFKEQYEAVQDEQVKILSDRVAELDFKLMGMAIHLDEDGIRLAVMKCLQSPKYVSALGTAIGLAIDKGMQNGLVASIDHGKAGRGLAEVAAYDPFMKERYVSAVLALRDLEFNFLSYRLQPAYEQLLLPIHRKEDNAVIGETSLSDSLNVVHDRVQKASTSGVPATTATTTALSISITIANVSSIPPISVVDYKFGYEDVPKFRRSYPCCPDLYAPLPSASVTSYGPSYLGLSFPPSSVWLASLFWYTRSSGLKLVLRTLEL